MLRKGGKLLQPLRELGTMVADFSNRMDYRDVQRLVDTPMPPGDFRGYAYLNFPSHGEDGAALTSHLEDGNPVELATQLSDLHAQYPHMDVFGGCCGTGDKHLREIAKSLRPRLSRAGKRPDPSRRPAVALRPRRSLTTSH